MVQGCFHFLLPSAVPTYAQYDLTEAASLWDVQADLGCQVGILRLQLL